MKSSSPFLPPVWVSMDNCLSGQPTTVSIYMHFFIKLGHPLQAPPLNETNNQGDGFGAKEFFLSILLGTTMGFATGGFATGLIILVYYHVIMIGGTILVWKYGPLDGNPTWPADLGILFQCFILLIVSFFHLFAWGNIVMMNGPILSTCAIAGFIIQVIEEKL